MRGYIGCMVGVLLLSSTVAVAAEKARNGGNSEEKLVSGMSIVGNNETPKSLVIVPWKSSEIGRQTPLNSSLLNERMVPVDKAVFMRELDFYKLSNESSVTTNIGEK